ncbi:molecular chaperone HtpG [Azospirillum brasilense]|uniref:Chaperone protein HtpG n=1 Tax=Azospirillum brasilense TaxID=192 RepID=A0A0P0EJP9_AZOBR|nr:MULTISPECIES: molecular chaperone HtpG [Azospirillum]ALJ34137.1 heat-shock protein Hsp90 [Azospirillum brasilense]MDW7552885.1 molecular chaperone HtpG [Azospirillum brasilense]MDW7591923.1 molecular chaperone HtpG [Azospirillum brasilense]MDW7627800.1 molecular chaperone HtpG [Azospirillum brasilense]MDX5952731.1 molecular chaperone HtpG [Azospirillum brasilense]
MTEERLSFQAEVSRLLDIVAHSLYSEKEVFLRELVSNASDACDRLRYAALTQPELSADDPNLKVRLIVDKEARTLTVADNGIGMNREDLVENLGTIARSGTAAFMRNLKDSAKEGDAKKDVNLIGQFGVGFYSAFMVADRVEVLTRKAGETQGWRWLSDGKGEFTISDVADLPRGTQITLHLREGDDEYLEEHRLSAIVRKYSDHIAIPILFGDGEEAKPLNSASALWMRSKNEITAEQYKEFYHHVGHAFDDPWLTLHWRAEGAIEYTNLLFVPSSKPFDLFDPKRAHRVKLYVKRVFITDSAEGLLPPYLRFLRGVVDSEDLPLNISREMLQHNPMLAKIRAGITRRVLSELGKKARDTEKAEEYAAFWENFGAVLKEGLYDDYEHRDDLLKLMRFRSTAGDGLVSLEEYLGRMKEGQEAIFTISGDDIETLKRSPQLEGFKAKGVEVLLLTDPVDEFWVPSVGSFQDKPFKSVTRGGADLGKIQGGEEKPAEEKASEGELTDLLVLLKLTLQDVVKDVRPSERLTDSAVCLVADENDMDMHLERLLKQHKQLGMDAPAAKRILEVNPAHPLIKRLAERAKASGAATSLDDAAWLLLDQARIVEGEALPDPAAFARRLASAMEKGLA